MADYLHRRLTGQPVDLEQLLNRVRISPAAERMQKGSVAYEHGLYDLELALKLNHFPFAMEVFRENGDLVGRTHCR